MLRDFVNQHAKAIGKLTQATLNQQTGFIAAVRKRREAAGIDKSPRGSSKPSGKKPTGSVEVNPDLEDWTNMRMVLMDTLAALKSTLGQSDGVDVFGLKARRRILHYDDSSVPPRALRRQIGAYDARGADAEVHGAEEVRLQSRTAADEDGQQGLSATEAPWPARPPST